MNSWDNWKEMTIEQIVPSFWWTHTSDAHALQIHVPGFKDGEVSLRVNDGVITVRGERQVNRKIIHFEQSYMAPNDSDTEEASGTFKNDMFYINIPKKAALPEPQIPEVACKDEEPPMICLNDEGLPEEEESNVVKKIAKQVKKNSTEIIIAVIAFSLGVLVLHGYKRGKGEKRSQ